MSLDFFKRLMSATDSQPSEAADAILGRLFGRGTARRMMCELDKQLSRMTSYRGELELYLLSISHPNSHGSTLVINGGITAERNDALPRPEAVRNELMQATLSAIARHLRYKGRFGITLSDLKDTDGAPFRFQGTVIVRSGNYELDELEAHSVNIDDPYLRRYGIDRVKAYKPSNPPSFSTWFDYWITELNLTNANVARSYKALRHLFPPRTPARHATKSANREPKSLIGELRTAKKIPQALVVYRAGRALEELGAPVNGLDALLNSDHWLPLFHILGAHVVVCAKAAQRPLRTDSLEKEPLSHLLPLFAALKPLLHKGLIEWRLAAGLRLVDGGEFLALIDPAPIEPLYPKNRTALMDESFRLWMLGKTDESREGALILPPHFAMVTRLLAGKPDVERIDLAREVIEGFDKDVKALLDIITPAWAEQQF